MPLQLKKMGQAVASYGARFGHGPHEWSASDTKRSQPPRP